MNTDESYVKKLERRIHNQRVRLKQLEMFENWQREGRSHHLNPRWFRKVLEQGKEIRILKEYDVNKIEKLFYKLSENWGW